MKISQALGPSSIAVQEDEGAGFALPPDAMHPSTPPVARTILVVEDDRTTRLLVATYLAQAGYHVLEAGRVRDAVSMFEDRQVDLMLVDGLLPDGTGVEVIRTFRERGQTAPIIFVSAFFKARQGHEMLSQQLGVSGILGKPLDPDRLLVEVQKALTDARATSSLQSGEPLPLPVEQSAQ